MSSQFIPKSNKTTKPTVMQYLAAGTYIGKLKITLDKYPIMYRFGFSIAPKYKQLEINFGLFVLTFAYRG